jgi:type IV secretory pathway protease TraF
MMGMVVIQSPPLRLQQRIDRVGRHLPRIAQTRSVHLPPHWMTWHQIPAGSHNAVSFNLQVYFFGVVHQSTPPGKKAVATKF